MLFDDKTKGIAQAYMSMLGESHFKVGDKVKCVASGMAGTVTKLDKPEEGKYYTVKTDAGKEMKYAPDELKKLDEAIEIEMPAKSKGGKNMKHDDESDEEAVAGEMKVKKKGSEKDQKIDELSTATMQSYRDKTGGSVNKRVSSTATKTDVQRKDRNQRVGRSSADNKIIKKAFEDYEWDWDAILEAPDHEIDALIEDLTDDELESFVAEFESLEESKNMGKVAKEIEVYAKKSGGIDRADMLKVAAMLNRGQVKQARAFAKTLDTDPRDYILNKMGMMEGNNWYQGSSNSTQPTMKDPLEGKHGRSDELETLEPRAEADKAFADAHRQSVDVKDYPGKDKPIANAKPQAPLRRGDKRNSEPKKTLSDIRNK